MSVNSGTGLGFIQKMILQLSDCTTGCKGQVSTPPLSPPAPENQPSCTSSAPSNALATKMFLRIVSWMRLLWSVAV
jgi:hypothetical protein